MARRGRKNSSNSKFFGFVLLASVIGGAFYFYQTSIKFNPQSLVDNSVLKQKNFDTKVEEVFSSTKKVKAYLFEDKTNPIISINFIFKNAGLASDNKDEEGIANLFASILTNGAGKYDNIAFTEELENNAISIGYSADMDNITGSLLTTVEHKNKAFELLKQTLLEPRFDEEEISRIKDKMLLALKKQKEHPVSQLSLEYRKELYGNHPYSRNPVGNEKSIKLINKQKLIDFSSEHLTLNNLIIGVAGDISKEELSVVLDDIFGQLPRTGSINFVRQADVKFDGRVKNLDRASKQNISMIAMNAVARNDADFYPLYIANYIFGGAGLNSRISQSIRESQGLTYSISSSMSLSDKSPLIITSFSTTPENYKKVTTLLNEQFDLIMKNGVSKQELIDAKNYLISSYNLRFNSISSIAMQLAFMQKEDLGIDFLQKRNSYVEAVKLDDVNRVAKKYFDKNAIVAVNIGSFD